MGYTLLRIHILQSIFFLRLSFSLGLVAILCCGCGQTSSQPRFARHIGTVDLSVDFGGVAPNIDVQIPCSEDSTVFDVLTQAGLNGDLKLRSSGRGETAFVGSIDGVGDQSGGDKYWTYLLNGQLAKTGSGVTEVAPGDQVRWQYGPTPKELMQ